MGWKCFDHDRRVQLEMLVRAGHSKEECAALLGCHISTIYRELARGRCQQVDYLWRSYYVYSVDVAQADADAKRSNCGAPLKIGGNVQLIEYIEQRIIVDRWSPAVVSADLRRSGGLYLSKDTIYRYAHRRVLPSLRPHHLPEKGIRKHPWTRVTPQEKKPRYGTSIEQRPPEIAARTTFGNWEQDCVIGQKKGKEQALLVMTERQTRAELVFKLPAKDTASVVAVLDRLQAHTDFSRIFRSITMDNGSEFADAYRMEFDKKGHRRTSCFYCHPYASCERGSNENQNRLVRRWYKKGRSLAAVTDDDAQQLSRWMNTYRRKLLDWDTPAERFLAACATEGVTVSPWLMQYLQ